jgi:hypothetical protein
VSGASTCASLVRELMPSVTKTQLNAAQSVCRSVDLNGDARVLGTPLVATFGAPWAFEVSSSGGCRSGVVSGSKPDG